MQLCVGYQYVVLALGFGPTHGSGLLMDPTVLLGKLFLCIGTNSDQI